MASQPYVVSRWPRTDAELHAFVRYIFGVHIPTEAVCDDHVAPFDAFSDAYFAREPIMMILASRGLGGKSQLLATLANTMALCLGAEVNVLGGSASQSMRVQEVSQQIWHYKNAPTHMLVKENQLETSLLNGAKIRALMASSRSVRGPHPSRLLLDECWGHNTLVSMSNGGLKTIQDVAPGDEVLCWDEQTNAVVSARVSRTISHGYKETIGLKWQGGEGRCTPNHPLYGKDGYTEAQEASDVFALSQVQNRSSESRPMAPQRCESYRSDVHYLLPDVGVTRQGSNLSDVRRAEGRNVSGLWQVLPQASSARRQLLHRLQGSVATWRQHSLSNMSLRVHEHAGSRDEDGSSTCSNVASQRSELVGAAARGTAGRDALQVREGTTDRSMDRGFLPAGLQHDGGCVRCDPSSPEARGARRQEAQAVDEERTRSGVPVGHRCEFVGLTIDRHRIALPVYDLTTEYGNFFANGILVHNCDEMDLNILDAALGQPMATPTVPSQITMSSTHQYPNGTVSQLLKRATDKGWPVYRWCFLESLGTANNPGWLTQTEIDTKKSTIQAAMWKAEFMMQEPSFEGRAIQTEDVDKMFLIELGQYTGDPLQYVQIEPPDEDGKYVTGVDFAKTKDWTVISTYRTDVHPWKMVAFQRMGRMGWPLMVARVNQRMQRFPGMLVYDHTGLGSVVGDYLNIDERRNKVYPVDMVGRDREILFSDYISGIEGHGIVAPRIQFAYAEHRYMTLDDIYKTGNKNHPPDSVVAGALAWSVRNKGLSVYCPPPDIDAARELSPWAM